MYTFLLPDVFGIFEICTYIAQILAINQTHLAENWVSRKPWNLLFRVCQVWIWPQKFFSQLTILVQAFFNSLQAQLYGNLSKKPDSFPGKARDSQHVEQERTE